MANHNLPHVEYRTIPDYPGYKIGDDGSVIGKRLNRPMKQHKQDGYLRVDLRDKSGARKGLLVHRLVLLAFVGPPPAGTETLHENDIRTDNRLSNLRWDSRIANIADGHSRGRFPIGERVKNAKLTEVQVKEIRELHADGHAYKSLARTFQLAPTTIKRIVLRQKWKHVA